MQGRLRSNTAPSTPLFEAPGKDPVELPGSFPIWSSAHYESRSSMDTVASSKHASVGRNIERPHSSPQHSSYAFHDETRQPLLATSRSAVDVRTTTGPILHQRHPNASTDGQRNASGQSLQTPANVTVSAPSDLDRESFRKPDAHRDGTGASTGGERVRYRPFVPPVFNTVQDEAIPPTDSRALLDQISTMRRSHEAHVTSLREAHDREVDSHRSYILFLEGCATTGTVPQRATKRSLTLDTSHVTGRTDDLQSLDVSASTSLQSLDSSLEGQRRTSVESVTAETEALKRKLSLCRKTQSELGDVRRERDRFRETSDKSERRIAQLKDIVRKSKDTEKAMRNKVQSLEAALLAANVQRIDVLEGYREACEQISGLHDKQLAMMKEREDASARSTSTKSNCKKGSVEQSTQTMATDIRASAITPASISRQLESLHQQMAEKDSRIKQLEAEIEYSIPSLEMRKLESQLKDSETAREQYNTLLHAELRRQSKIVALNAHTGTPQVESEAAVTVAEKLNSKPGSENPEKRCEFLEKELKHCVSEIILYKLDIRGYRKDLKETNARLKDIQTSNSNRPATPDSMEARSGNDKASTPQRRPRATSGLGISLQRSETPTRPLTNRLSTPLQQARGMPSPTSKVTTPLELDKQLPKPPTASRDPRPNLALSPPTTALNRAETMRSLSESIISSYANRATPEQVQGYMPPLCRGRSAEQPRVSGLRLDSYRAIDAVAVPISRYTPDMLKTPNMAMTKSVGA